MKRVIIAVAVSSVFSAPVFASGYNVGQGNGDKVTINVTPVAQPVVLASPAVPSNNSANGGLGGEGGSATGGVGNGGSGFGGNAVGGMGGAGGTGGIGGSGGSGIGGSSNANGSQSVTVNETQVKQYRPVPAPAPVYVAVPNGSCKTGAGVSVTGGSFGVSVGGAVMDESCNARYDAAALESLGLHDAAIARLAQSPEVARALDDAYGTRYSTKPEAQPVNSNNWQGVQ